MAHSIRLTRRLLELTVALTLTAVGFVTSCSSLPPDEQVGSLDEQASIGGTISRAGTTGVSCTASGNACISGGKEGTCIGTNCCTTCILLKGTTPLCEPGTTTGACGSNLGGAQCKACVSGGDCQSPDCSTGTCQQKVSPDQTGCSAGRCNLGVCCAGCVDANGACQKGTTLTACSTAGSPGALCNSCDDNNPCTDDACDANSGCTHTFNANATCSDGDACTTGEHCVTDGMNVTCGGGTALSCDDNKDCTKDSCDPTQGCLHDALNGTACSDSGTCAANTMCSQGVCVGNGVSCDDKNPCTNDDCTNGTCPAMPHKPEAQGTPCVSDLCHQGMCDNAGKCVQGAAIDCDDANPCTTDTCDPASGCAHQADDTQSCSDGDACTTGDKCTNGVCAGSTVTCTALDECHKPGTCDMTAGGCSDPRQDDGFACTGGTCMAGKCVLADGGIVTSSGGAVGSGGSTGISGEAGETASGGTLASGGATVTPPAHVFVRNPGGCSCRVPSRSSGERGPVLLLAVMIGAAFARRRRSA
ncbi:MAG TPA: MYXO-CTERM sorting domain-containing protein [Polyangiaceae bacterium]|jgi:MYXO-CTERM domain-containing protein